MNPSSAADIYTRPDVVAGYDREHELHEAEALLFKDYVKPGSRVLDLGVGAGRTTSYLARSASRYVGIDLSQAMLARCREKFPELTFLRLDATDLSVLPGASFDVVVFSFNGLDTIPSLEGRRRCLAECSRVLRPGGAFLFSVHNARFLIFSPVLNAVSPLRAVWRIAYAVAHSAAYLVSRLPSAAFRAGAGFAFDPLAHGGVTTYIATPQHVAGELAEAGLLLVRCVPGQFPRNGGPLRTPWYYYAGIKRDA